MCWRYLKLIESGGVAFLPIWNEWMQAIFGDTVLVSVFNLKKRKTKIQELRTDQVLLVVHLPTSSTSLLHMPLFSDRNTSVYIRPSLFLSSLDTVQIHHCVSATGGCNATHPPSWGRPLQWFIHPPYELPQTWVLLGAFIWYICARLLSQSFGHLSHLESGIHIFGEP